MRLKKTVYTCAVLLIALSIDNSFISPRSLLSAKTGALTVSATYLGTHTYERVGYTLAGPGDVNGDGFSDFAVGCMHSKGLAGEMDAGALYMILGKTNGFILNQPLNQAAEAVFHGQNALEETGVGASLNGDVNGDGLDDVLIGAPNGRDESDPGHAYLVFGRRNADWGKSFIVNRDADVVFTGEKPRDSAGWSVDIVKDMNSDGFDELLIGAFSNEQTVCRGKAYLFKGRASWNKYIPLASADASFVGTVDNGNAGYSVAGVGDMNGDGVCDFVVGQPEKYASPTTGRVFLLFGRKNMNWGSNFNLNGADVVIRGESGWAGWRVADAGDANGDGLGDLVIGAPYYGYNQGKVYLVLGRNSGWPSPFYLSGADASFVGEYIWRDGDKVGHSVKGGGDFNRDGYSDFLIGVNMDAATNSGGKVYLVKGKRTGWRRDVNLNEIPDYIIGENPGNSLGYDVTFAGDFNGDWVDDFAASAPWFSTNNPAAGKVYLVKGDKWFKAVAGSVLYGNQAPVPNVQFRFNGNFLGKTDPQAGYLLALNPGSSGTVTPSLSTESDSAISFYDAALAARIVVKLDLPGAERLKAADANGDGTVTAGDAAEIARYAVGFQGSGTVRAGTWFFEPPGRLYSNIQSDITGQDYTGIIRGDADLSWGSGLSKLSVFSRGAMEKEVIRTLDTLRIEFRLNRPVPMWSFDICLDYDTKNLSYIGYETGEACSDFTLFDNAQAGVLRIGGYRAEGPDAEGRLVVLKFQNQTGIITPGLRLRKARIDRAVIDRDVELVSGVESIPDPYPLLRNYPNPFNSRTVVEYLVERDGHVRLGVYDVMGRLIHIVEDGNKTAGSYRTLWDGTDGRGKPVPGGMYVVRMKQGEKIQSMKIIFLK